jgi:hypothetical protein
MASLAPQALQGNVVGMFAGERISHRNQESVARHDTAAPFSSPLEDLRASYVKKRKITSARLLRYASAAWR